MENRIVIELKSVEEMRPVYWKQTLTYLRLLNLHIGILVNFSSDSIKDDIYRIAN